MKDNPASPGSQAMILYREEIVDNNGFFEDYYYRIKIFTDAGKKLADIQIPFIKGYFDIKNVKARTVHPDGKIVEFDGRVLDKLLVKSGDIKVQAKSITLPDVSPGSIIEYRYRIQHNGVSLGANWRIQEGVYTRQAHFVFQPYKGPIAAALLWRGFRVGDVKPQRQKDGSWSLEVNNIAGLPEEDYTLPVEELRGRVEFVYTTEQHTAEAKEYWDRVAKGWAEGEGNFIGNHVAIRDLAAKLTSPSDTPESKLRKFYARAQELRNLSDEEEKTAQEEKRDKTKANNNVEDILKHGYASKTNVDRFFVALAQAAGFDAAILWVTPRSKSRFHMEMQDRNELSDALVFVHAGDKDYFLNPGISLCPFGLLPWYETNISAMRPTKNGAVFLQTPNPQSSLSATERHAQLTLDPDGSLAGTLVIRFTGQRALSRRAEARDEDEVGKTKMITDEIKGWLPSSAKFDLTSITGWDKSDVPLEVQGKLRLPGVAESVGRRLLLPLGVYESGQRQMFDNAAREQDVYFHYPFEDVDDITIQLPSGFHAEKVPAPLTVEPGGDLHYTISAKQEGDALHVQRRLTVGGILYPVSSYTGLRHFFSTAKADDEQQLVLQTTTTANHN